MRPRSRIDYQLEDKFDVVLFLSVFLLTGIGLVAIYSATLHNPSASGNFTKQLFWVGVSTTIFFITYFASPRSFNLVSVPSYIFTILLLVAVLVIGKRVYGQKCWIDIGPFSMQPSEFAKVGTVLFLSMFLSREKTNIESIWSIITGFAIGFIPVILILLEPDMGTALVFLSLTVVLVFWKGISLFGLFTMISPGLAVFSSMFGTVPFIICLAAVAAGLFFFKKKLIISGAIFAMNLGAGFIFNFVFKYLSPHQKQLIETFVDPNSDPLGAGYNAIQAKVAIGSGGLLGKGYLMGNQTQLRFIPEQWTDFIFCVIGEEFGLIGSLIVVSLFFFLFFRLLKIASQVRERNEFNSFVVIGTLAVLFTHFAINIGMTVGLMPIIGVPLPFLSYGGSSLMANMFLVGIVANIYKNRKQYT
ncbi:MAG TPA: rod shape-determining protein RodA [Ignavibacteriales bacterium]|nr:rod shape-determining protein RodA [Ignavibacteriales bacterium]